MLRAIHCAVLGVRVRRPCRWTRRDLGRTLEAPPRLIRFSVVWGAALIGLMWVSSVGAEPPRGAVSAERIVGSGPIGLRCSDGWG